MAQVLVQERLIKKIERTLNRLAEQQEEYLTEEKAAKFLGVSVRTLQNQISAGKIDPTLYVTNVLGKRMYCRSKLIVNDLISDNAKN